MAEHARSWRDFRELGNTVGIRFLVVLCRVLGRTVVRATLYPIVLYYVLTKTTARQMSRDYWRRLTGARVGWICVYRHFLRFAQCTVDRYLFACGRTRGIEVSIHGHHYLQEAQRQGRGALLLGAHLGSFEAMRAASAMTDVRVTMVADFRGSRRIAGLLEKQNPALRAQLIPAEDGFATVLRIKEHIDAGEAVALLADRAEPNARVLRANFLGAPALFPIGPYMLAATLGCPVFLTFGIHRSPNHYDIYCEPFAERISLSQRHRDPELRTLVQRYADRLEHYCRTAPDNWFNFFDFWAETASLPALPARRDAQSYHPSTGSDPA